MTDTIVTIPEVVNYVQVIEDGMVLEPLNPSFIEVVQYTNSINDSADVTFIESHAVIMQTTVTVAGSEGTVPTTTRVDFISDDVFYKGEAVPGSSENGAVWKISKTTVAVDGDVQTLWADGVATATKVWANRADYTYI